MTIFEAFILGIVQGLTEFLPVSSSGHTIIAGKLLGLYEVPLEFELIIHLGTLLAVIIAMRKKILPLIKKPLSKTTLLLIVASVPTAVIFLTFKSFFKFALNGDLLVYCFLITAALIIISEFIASKEKSHAGESKTIGFFDAVVIGTVQGVAALPGISRSGSTVCASMMLGNSKEESLDFSFLLSIPVILGSAAAEFIFGTSSIGVSIHVLLVGLVTAFAFGLLGVKFIQLLLKNHSLNGFAVYLFLLSLFMIVNDAFLHLF